MLDLGIAELEISSLALIWPLFVGLSHHCFDIFLMSGLQNKYLQQLCKCDKAETTGSSSVEPYMLHKWIMVPLPEIQEKIRVHQNGENVGFITAAPCEN